MRMMRWGGFALLGWAWVGNGCAAFAGRAATKATEPVVEETLQTLVQPENREAARALLASPEIQEGARVLAAAVAGGLVQGLSEDENRQVLDALAAELGAQVAREAVRELRAQLLPVLRQSLQQDLRPVLRDTSAQVARGFVAGMQQAAAEQRAREGLGPDEGLLARARLLLRRTLILELLVAAAVLAAAVGAVVLLLARRRRNRRAAAAPAAVLPPAGGVGSRDALLGAFREMVADPQLRRALLDELRRPPAPPPH